jgi:hypothetical protein
MRGVAQVCDGPGTLRGRLSVITLIDGGVIRLFDGREEPRGKPAVTNGRR